MEMNLVQSIYDFTSSDPKILNFGVGERFIVIKSSKPPDWIYVVNLKGQLGYIPASYIQDAEAQLKPEQLLQIIDTIASRVDTKNNDLTAITERQVKHAQIKLAQLRCQVVQKMLKDVNSKKSLVESTEEIDGVTQDGKSLQAGKVNGVHEVDRVGVPAQAIKGNPANLGSSATAPQGLLPESTPGCRLSSSSSSSTEEKFPLPPPCAEKQIPPKSSPVILKNMNNVANDHCIPPPNHGPKGPPPATAPKPKPPPPPPPVQNHQLQNHVSQQQPPPPPPQQNQVVGENSNIVPGNVVIDLVERVRMTSRLSHEMSKLTVKAVLNCLQERLPHWSPECHDMIAKLESEATYSQPEVFEKSEDLQKFRELFKKMWSCKNDEQQRSWPVHEDEEMIAECLKTLLNLVSHSNPAVVRHVLFSQNMENVETLITYFQMETRRSLRIILLQIFMSMVTQFPRLIIDCFLQSVLPAELASEMTNHRQDVERWCLAASLFTAIFATGHKPPLSIYEHINENFIMQQLELIEGVDSVGERIEHAIPPEVSIGPILGFNLHFDCPALGTSSASLPSSSSSSTAGSDTGIPPSSSNASSLPFSHSANLVLRALRLRPTAAVLTENLVSYLNWEEDITRTILHSHRHTAIPSDEEIEFDRPNAVLKLLVEMLSDSEVAKLFYFNDVRVIVDIIIRQLENLPVGDEGRAAHLVLAQKILLNTPYKEEPHKLLELKSCFEKIEEDENSSKRERHLIKVIKFDHVNLFK